MSSSRSKAALTTLTAASPATIAPDEAAKVAAARGGDREAFAWLVERHQDRVFGLAFRLCRGDRDDAEELAQESFLRALRGLPNFRGESAFSTWMHRIVLNLHMNQRSTLAAKGRRRQFSLGAPRDDDDGPRREAAAPARKPVDLAAESEQLALLRAAFDGLDEARRVIVLLRDVEGRSYEEIAALLDIPIGTVRSRLSRAREELSERLGGSGFRGGQEDGREPS